MSQQSDREGNKPKKWAARRYFGKFNKFRDDHWVFGDRTHADGTGRVPHLVKHSWTEIVRHQTVQGRASPDDPDLNDYWAARRRRVKPPLDSYTVRLLDRQHGRCPLCGDHLLAVDQPPQTPHDWENWWHQVTRRAIQHNHLVHHRRPGTPDTSRTHLVHSVCHRRTAAPQPATPSRLA